MQDEKDKVDFEYDIKRFLRQGEWLDIPDTELAVLCKVLDGHGNYKEMEHSEHNKVALEILQKNGYIERTREGTYKATLKGKLTGELHLVLWSAPIEYFLNEFCKLRLSSYCAREKSH